MSYLLDSYCVPGTALNKSHASSHLILTFEVGIYFVIFFLFPLTDKGTEV